MAEKEERIVLLVTKPKGECPCQIDKDYCKETCWVKGKCSLGMTRQEAIEKMAKALYRYMYGDTDYKTTQFEEMYLERAETALNALLSSGESND